MKVEVNKSRNLLSDRVKGSNNGTARIVEFVDLGKEVEGWGAGFGIEEKGCHPWISLGRDQQW